MGCDQAVSLNLSPLVYALTFKELKVDKKILLQICYFKYINSHYFFVAHKKQLLSKRYHADKICVAHSEFLALQALMISVVF